MAVKKKTSAPKAKAAKAPARNRVIGVDLGGTNIVFALTDLAGKILYRLKVPTMALEGRDKVVARMVEGIRRVMEESGTPAKELQAVGVGVPGPISSHKGIIYSAPNLPGFENLRLKALLERKTGLPVFLENDANAAAMGEKWAGAGKGVDSMLMLTLGTGVGGGIVLDGKLYSGVNDTAAEFGHMVIDPGGPICGCGQRGCLEQYASATAIARRAREAVMAGTQSSILTLAEGDPSKITSRMVHQAALDGDRLARQVWDDTAVFLGIGIANLVNIFNPQMVVLGGGVMLAGGDLLKPVRQEVLKRAFERPAKTAQIVSAKLGDDAGVIGAAAVAITRSL
jgi:glucokinase